MLILVFRPCSSGPLTGTASRTWTHTWNKHCTGMWCVWCAVVQKLSARLLRSKLCTGTNKNKNHLHAFQSRSWLFNVISYKPSKHILPRHSCIGPGPTGLTWALHGTYETRKHKEHLKTLKRLACLICSGCIWMIAFHLWKFMPNLGKHVPPKKVTPFSEAVLLLVGPFLGKNSFFRLPYRRTSLPS